MVKAEDRFIATELKEATPETIDNDSPLLLHHKWRKYTGRKG
jgi:hypothetical protein